MRLRGWAEKKREASTGGDREKVYGHGVERRQLFISGTAVLPCRCCVILYPSLFQSAGDQPLLSVQRATRWCFLCCSVSQRSVVDACLCKKSVLQPFLCQSEFSNLISGDLTPRINLLHQHQRLRNVELNSASSYEFLIPLVLPD